MTPNGERLGNHALCLATIFGIEQFPSERIYIASTQKCSYSIFLKKKTTIHVPWLPDDAAFISYLLRPAVDRHLSFIHVAFTQAFRIATSICSS